MPQLIASAKGNKVTFVAGFDDIPQHHHVHKRKSIKKGYPKQVKSQLTLRLKAREVSNQIRKITSQHQVFNALKSLYTCMVLLTFMDDLLECQNNE